VLVIRVFTRVRMGSIAARLVLVIRVFTRVRMGSIAARLGCNTVSAAPLAGTNAWQAGRGRGQLNHNVQISPRGSRSAIAGHRKRRHATFDQRFRQLLPWVACRVFEAFDRARLRGPAMTYSSWGNACGLCSRRSCRCLQCRLGRSSEARRERASSCQSDNDPDFPRSANPAGRRSRICGATFAWRPSYGGRTHICRQENLPTRRTTLELLPRVPALRPRRREVRS